jgi:hypothetical protein
MIRLSNPSGEVFIMAHPASLASAKERLDRPIRVGVFRTVGQADQAVDGLLAAGFTRDQITVMCSDKHVERHFQEFEHQKPAGTNTPAAAAAGSVIGAAVGGVAAVAGLVTTGGVAVLAAGGIAAWAGGVVGGLIGAMMTRGVEKELADFYDQALTEGKILVAAEDESGNQARLNEAERIIAAAGAEPMPLPEG